MNRWVHGLVSYSPEEVQEYCVKDPHWQMFRERLKGLPTARKLDNLEIYRGNVLTHNSTDDQHRMEVQVSNYLNALKRGGQLTMDLEVQR